MSKEKKLFGLCQSQDLNVSLTWQKINDWSVEIYLGNTYRKIFYTDGHTRKKDALKEAIEFMETFDRMKWQSEPQEITIGLKVSIKQPTVIDTVKLFIDHLDKHHDDGDKRYEILAMCAASQQWILKNP
ncbi:hypothetical protein [Sulfurimonas sp.]|uniref:hypothetical protein n=1 Tax=Sulfurimonas sp. TaxID=2022749 RepID=UPI002B45CC26|nr:hypothetical protein [Sulfurimonas sp.]